MKGKILLSVLMLFFGVVVFGQRDYRISKLKGVDTLYVKHPAIFTYKIEVPNSSGNLYSADTLVWTFIKSPALDFDSLQLYNYTISGDTARLKIPIGVTSTSFIDTVSIYVKPKLNDNSILYTNRPLIASIIGNKNDINTSNNTITNNVYVLPSARFYNNSLLTITCNNNEAHLGDTIDYTITCVPKAKDGSPVRSIISILEEYIDFNNGKGLTILETNLPVTDYNLGQPYWDLGTIPSDSMIVITMKCKIDSVIENYGRTISFYTNLSDTIFRDYTSNSYEYYYVTKATSCNPVIFYPNNYLYDFNHDILATGELITANKTVTYRLTTYYKNNIDSIKNDVYFVKDSRTQFISSIPTPTTIIGDTLIWRYKTYDYNFNTTGTAYYNGKTIEINLNVPINAQLTINDTLHYYSKATITNASFGSLTKYDTLINIIANDAQQVVVDNTNNLLAAPQGIQWVRPNDFEARFGSNSYSSINNIKVIDSTNAVVLSIVENYLPNQNIKNNVVVLSKYTTNGQLIFKQHIDSTQDIDFYGYNNLYIYNVKNSADILCVRYNNKENKIFVKRFNADGVLLWNSQKLLDSTYNLLSLDVSYNDNGDIELLFNREIAYNYGNLLAISKITRLKISNNGSISIVGELPNVNLSRGITAMKKVNNEYFAIEAKLEKTKRFINNGYSGSVEGGNNTFVSKNFLSKYDDNFNKIFEKEIINYGQLYLYKIFVNTNDNTISVFGELDYSIRYNSDLNSNATDSTIYFNNGSHGGYNEIQYLKLSTNGDVLINKAFGGRKIEYVLDILQTNNGDFILGGAVSSVNDGNINGVHTKTNPNMYGSSDEGWLLRINQQGNVVWQKPIGASETYSNCYALAEFPNGELMVAGDYGEHYIGNSDFYGKGGSYVLKIGATNVIRGEVFVDINNDSIKEDDEPWYDGAIVQSKKDSITSSSNIVEGKYANVVDTGTYVTKPLVKAYYTLFPAQHTSIFTGYQMADTANFRLVPIAGINDLRILVTPVNTPRPGFPVKYVIDYQNVGTTTLPGILQLIKDNKTIFDSASVVPDVEDGDTLRWNVGALAPEDKGTIVLYLTVKAPPAVTNTDSLTHEFSINPIIGDTTPLDNKIVLQERVRGSYDPNDKTEVHGNTLTPLEIASGEYLLYTIRFQNTGNDTAFRVIIRDTLTDKLDWNSFEMVSASHNYTLNIKDGNKAEWKFDPIFLEDSTSNEPASHGYVSFRIKAKPTLMLGEQIKNKAHIYFDFNEAVITNTQTNTVTNPILLPLTWLNITATKNEKDVVVTWQTVNERNVAYFEVLHSIDGIRFTKIGVVNANNSTLNKYTFKHEQPAFGINYYRLNQVDTDSRSKQSAIAAVNVATDVAIGIYPNPATNVLNINLYNLGNENATISIVDALGRQKLQKNITNTGNRISLDISSFAKGMYFVRVMQGGSIKTLAFEKL